VAQRTTTGMDQFNDVLGRGGMYELVDIPLSGRIVQAPGITAVTVQWDEGPDLSLFSEGRACYRAPLAYLVESFSIHADDDGHPGRKSRFLLNVVGRDYGFYPVHTFRRVVIGGQWSDAWFTYTLAVSVMIAPCGFFQAQLANMDPVPSPREMSVVIGGKLARPL
jgi:hypothetical protein